MSTAARIQALILSFLNIQRRLVMCLGTLLRVTQMSAVPLPTRRDSASLSTDGQRLCMRRKTGSVVDDRGADESIGFVRLQGT